MDLIFLRFAFAGGLLSALLVALGHWMPWPRIIKKDLPLLWRYIYGVLSIMAGFALAVLHMGNPNRFEVIITIAIVASFSGITVFRCHAIDNAAVPDDTGKFSQNYKEAYDELRDERD